MGRQEGGGRNKESVSHLIEDGLVDAVLGVERTRLRDRLQLLEVVACKTDHPDGEMSTWSREPQRSTQEGQNEARERQWGAKKCHNRPRQMINGRREVSADAPVFQSHMYMEPLSPPETSTPSRLTASELTIELWPDRLRRKRPSGHLNTFRLSAPAEQNVNLRKRNRTEIARNRTEIARNCVRHSTTDEHGSNTRGQRQANYTCARKMWIGRVANAYSVGCSASARIDFLWCVRMHVALPVVRSHRRTVLSCDPVIICDRETRRR